MNNASNVYYRLTTDIDLAQKYFLPINNFKANLDGDNHIISNLYLYSHEGIEINGTRYLDSALFMNNNGSIENLYIKNAHIVNSSENKPNGIININTAGLVAINYGLVRNVSVVADIISNTKNTAGVIALNKGVSADSYAIAKTIIADGIIKGMHYTAGVIGENEAFAEANSLGNNAIINVGVHGAGVIAKAYAGKEYSNLYNTGLIATDNNNSISGILNVFGSGNLVLNNAYSVGEIYYHGSYNSSTEYNLAMLVSAYDNANITLNNCNVIDNISFDDVSVALTGKEAYTTGTITKTNVLNSNLSTLQNIQSSFSPNTWDYVNIWSIYSGVNSGLPVFKHFNDYIVKVGYTENLTVVKSDVVGSGEYSKYFSYTNPAIIRNVVLSDTYVIDVDTDNVSITQSGANSNTISINNAVINDDGTMYIYRGATVPLRVTSIIYRHISTITLDHEISSIADITSNYDRVSDNHDSNGKKVGVVYNTTPVASVSDMYDRNRVGYFIVINDELDTYDISVSTLENTDDKTVKLIKEKGIKISENAGNTTISGNNPTLTNIPHGSTVSIEVTLNDILLTSTTNIRVDYWLQEVDNTNADGNGYNYLIDNRTIANSVETSDNKFAINKIYNIGSYTMYNSDGSIATYDFNVTNGKLNVSFVATAETSGNYVLSLIKQWLVSVKFNLSIDIGADYPIAYVNGYEENSIIEFANPTDAGVDNAYMINQEVGNIAGSNSYYSDSATFDSNAIYTKSYNRDYYSYSGNNIQTNTLDTGEYTIAGITSRYDQANNLESKDYIGNSFTTKIFVDNGASINYNTYAKENYTFTGFTQDTVDIAEDKVTENSIVVNNETMSLFTYREEVTSSKTIVANYIPSKHYVNVIVDNGGDFEYNNTNGTVTALEKVPTEDNNTLTGTNITSEVRHARDLSITLNPDKRYTFDKCCIKYYVYKEVEDSYTRAITRYYYNEETDTWTTNRDEINANYLPFVRKYSEGALIKDASTLNITTSTIAITSNGVSTGDQNNTYTIEVGHLVGNLEIHVNYIRYYWNDTPTTTTLAGGGTKANPYKITKASDWGYIVNTSNSSNDYYKDTYFMVANDIDFDSRFTPSLNIFKGKIYGNKYTFRNVLLDAHLSLGSTTRHVSGAGSDYVYGMPGYNVTSSRFGLINTVYAEAFITSIKFESLKMIASINNDTEISGNAFVGLFAYNTGRIDNIEILSSDTDDTLISSITVESNTNLTSSHNKYVGYLGSIVGYNYGIVSNSINYANVEYNIDPASAGKSIYTVSGLVGGSSAQIINCINNGDVTIKDNGYTYASNIYHTAQGITYSYSTGLIYNVINNGNISSTSTNRAISNNNGTIINVINTGSAKGLIGYKFNDTTLDNLIIKNVVNIGNTTLGFSSQSEISSNAIYENIYYKDNLTPCTVGTALSTSQMSNASNFVGFDFAGEWDMLDGANRPTLRFENTIGYPTLGINNYSSTNNSVIYDTGLWIDNTLLDSITLDSLKKSIGGQDYYILDSAEDIAYLSRITTYTNANIADKTFVIASENPIDLSGRYFTPINSGSNTVKFNIIGIRKNANSITAEDLNNDADVDNVIISGMTIENNMNEGYANSYSSFIYEIYNGSIIKGIDFENVNIISNLNASTIAGYVENATITNCNYVSGSVNAYHNKDILGVTDNSRANGLVCKLSTNSLITSSTVTGYVTLEDGTKVLHQSYEFGNDLGGSINALNDYVNANGIVYYADDSTAVIKENYFNGVINVYNSINSIAGITGYSAGVIQDNYVKGKFNVYRYNSYISGLLYNGQQSFTLKNNYSATEFNMLKGGTIKVLNNIMNTATNYEVSKNYYLVDSVSSPQIGIGITNNTDINYGENTANLQTLSGIIEINSADLRNQVKFKAMSTWDFSNVWIYVNHINWDYPVLRAIYGGDTTDVDIVVYNPYKYSDSTMGLGNLNIDNNEIFYTDADGNIASEYANILHKDASGNIVDTAGNTVDASEYEGVSIPDNTTAIIFTYSVIQYEDAEFYVSNTTYGLITSTLFGAVDKAGSEVNGSTITEDITHYTEYADTCDNADIIITENMDKTNYGLIITFNERVFNVTVNATLTADAGTDGVEDKDAVTLLLVHVNANNVVDYAYSINLHNNSSFTFANIYNGTLDGVSEVNGRNVTTDSYGHYELFIMYPMFYLNDTANTSINASNISYNPTLVEGYKMATYTQYSDILTINNTNCNALSLGTFVLDTITRDISINLTINKPYEYWLHSNANNM